VSVDNLAVPFADYQLLVAEILGSLRTVGSPPVVTEHVKTKKNDN
jgi:hypothetical protein